MHNTGANTLDRFIWVLSFLARNDFVAIPVDQLQFDDSVLADRTTWGKVRGADLRAAGCICTPGSLAHEPVKCSGLCSC